jgi:hypothetical protein
MIAVFPESVVHYTAVLERIRNALLSPSWICFLWVGLSIGVSMIATPVRFTASTITRPVALDVGRVVFAALNKAELAALVLLLIVIRVSGAARRWWAVGALLTLIVLAQGVWLIPELAARTDIIIAGGEPPPSYAHAIYSSLELVKIGLLLYCGFSTLAERR